MHVDIAVETPAAWWLCTPKRFVQGGGKSCRTVNNLLEGGPFG